MRWSAQALLDKGLTTVSQTGLSIGAMLGFWVTAWAGSFLFATLGVETYVKRRWPSRSTLGLGAVVVAVDRTAVYASVERAHQRQQTR